MLPRLAIVDPQLTLSLPPADTATTGLDALTQLIEPYVSNSANPMTDSLCREAIPRAARALPRAFHNGADASAREEMSLASLFGGLALANAKLGAVHGLASPLGGLIPAPHGAICARLLPLIMETNIRALESRAPASPTLGRYAEIAHWLTGRPDASLMEGAEGVAALCRELEIRPLSDYGLKPSMIPEVVAQAQKASSMKGNPIPLTDDELSSVLYRSMR